MEQFALHLYVALRRYPKSERHVLAADTRGAAYRLLRQVIVLAKTQQKEKPLRAADIEISLINAQLRIAMELRFLPMPKYESLIRQTEECGRIIGGWLKNIK